MSQVLMLFVIEDNYKMFVFPEDSALAILAKAAHGYTAYNSEDLENAEAMSMVQQLSDYPNELSDDYPVIYDFAPYEVKMAECVDLRISAIYHCGFAV